MKQKMTILLVLVSTLLLATFVIKPDLFSSEVLAQGNIDYQYHIYDKDIQCGPGAEQDKVALRGFELGNQISLIISRCDESDFFSGANYEVWIDSDGNGMRDKMIGNSRFEANTNGDTFVYDPVSDEIYGPNDYVVYIYSDNDPDNPKITGVVRIREEYDTQIPSEDYIYHVGTTEPQCGGIVDVQIAETLEGKALEVTATRCDGGNFSKDGLMYIAVDGVPLWGPISYNDADSQVSSIIFPNHYDLPGTPAFQVFLFSNDPDDTSLKESGVVEVTRIDPPDIRLTKTVNDEIADPGEILTYTLSLTTTDGSINVTLTSSLPSEMTYVDGSATVGAYYDSLSHQIVYSGTLNTEIEIQYEAKVRADTPLGTILESQATLLDESGQHSFKSDVIMVAVPDPVPPANLVLLYVNGDNDLSKHMPKLLSRVLDSVENPHARVLIVYDGPQDNDGGLYQLDQDGDVLCLSASTSNCEENKSGLNLWENSGDASTLRRFIEVALRANGQADNVLLSVIGHGGGWNPSLLDGQPAWLGGKPEKDGLLWDTNPGGSISTRELGEALQQAYETTGRKIDLLYLDACLMAMAEVAYEVHESVNYLLASESWSWTSFAYDRHLGVLDDEKDVPQIAKAWLANEAEELRNFARDHDTPFTFSVVDLQKMPELFASLDILAQNLISLLPADREQMRIIFAEAECFDSNQNLEVDHKDDYCDLGSVIEQLSQVYSENDELMTSLDALKISLDAAVLEEDHQNGKPWNGIEVVDQIWAWEKLSGLSIYLPSDANEWKRRYYPDLKSSINGEWDDFINEYWIDVELPADPEPCLLGAQCPLPPGPLPLRENFATLDAFIDIGSDYLRLRWEPIDTETLVTNYRISRQIAGGSFVEIASLSSDVVQYIDTNLPIDRAEYCYRIWALSATDEEIGLSDITCVPFGYITLSMSDNLILDASEVEKVDVAVNIVSPEELCLSGIQISVQFNSDVIKVKYPEPVKSLMNENFKFTHHPLGNNTLRIAGISSPGTCQTITNTQIFSLTFGIQGNGISPLDFISGVNNTVLYAEGDPDTPISIELDNGSVVVENAISPEPPLASGDINDDNVTNVSDARIALQYSVGVIDLTPDQLVRCDVTQNGRCNAGDASKILCYATHQNWGSCGVRSQTNGALRDTSSTQVSISQSKALTEDDLKAIIFIEDGMDVAGADFTIIYNPSEYTFHDLALTSVTEHFALSSFVVEPGVLNVSLASNTPIGQDGSIIELDFKKEGEAKSPISINQVNLNNQYGEDFVTELQRIIEVSSFNKTGKMNKHYLPIISRN